MNIIGSLTRRSNCALLMHGCFAQKPSLASCNFAVRNFSTAQMESPKDLSTYFEEKMRQRTVDENQPVELPRAFFDKMVSKMKTEEDVKTVLDAYCNYLGHRNLISQIAIDAYLLKALEIGHPEATFEFKNHAELVAHPSEAVM